MAKVVAMSGAQGAGKTTLLKNLSDNGWIVDDFKVSRTVQERLNWSSLTTVLTSWETMVEFQEEILAQKFAHDYALRKDAARLILVERSFADVAAYTTQWAWQLHDKGRVLLPTISQWLPGYVRRCASAQEQCYGGLMLLPYMNNVPWENDLNRAAFHSVEAVYEDIARFAQRAQFLQLKTYVITAESVSDRAQQVEAFLEIF